MTTAKDEMLARIRSALGPHPDVPSVPRDYQRTGQGPEEGLIDLLVDRLTDYQAPVIRTDPDGISAAIADALGQAHRVVAPPGLPDGWLPADVEVVRDDGLDADALDALDAVVTGSTVAIAETGSIILEGSPDQGRRAITLVPDLHVCILRTDQVVATVPDGIAVHDAQGHRPGYPAPQPPATSNSTASKASTAPAP